MLKFKLLEDSDSNQKWVAGPMLDSDWPVYFILDLMYVEYCSEEMATDGKYHVSINAVAPDACKGEHESACSSMGMDLADFNAHDGATQAMLLNDYGTRAVLYQKQGNNKNALLRSARKEMGLISMLFGFYMDKPQNRIGSTGWDVMQGNLLAGLQRHQESKVNG